MPTALSGLVATILNICLPTQNRGLFTQRIPHVETHFESMIRQFIRVDPFPIELLRIKI